MSRTFNPPFGTDGPVPPCGKKCPDRYAGCAVTCERWKAYLEERNANYELRKRKAKAAARTAASEKTLANRHSQDDFMKKRTRRR